MKNDKLIQDESVCSTLTKRSNNGEYAAKGVCIYEKVLMRTPQCSSDVQLHEHCQYCCAGR